ncbi:MAG TPA: DUF3750 domain-containing protein [Hyphomicrobiaceae bacterium]|nr:DUF3750 domain-containing protein [Hyphomicrobiaceae bacterium]
MRRVLLTVSVLFLLPLGAHAAWWLWRDHPASWRDANWSSAGVLPPAAREPGAVVHVMAGRTGRWKGIFAHHTWIVTKARGAAQYTRYDVVGWGNALRVNAYAADAWWFGNRPEILLTVRGEEAQKIIPEIEKAVKSYAYRGAGTYTIWPGPNSNTFVATVARAVPELAPALLPTAIGKDFAGWPFYAGAAPSGGGFQISVGGLLGVTAARVEGLEFNFLGLVTGVDLLRPALKLPGWGRLSVGQS